VFSLIVEGAAESAGSGAGIVVRVIVGVLTAPLSALAASVLYFELRARLAGSVPGGGDPYPADPGPDGGASDLGDGPGAGRSDAERAFGG
jgi:hypothetical protein